MRNTNEIPVRKLSAKAIIANVKQLAKDTFGDDESKPKDGAPLTLPLYRVIGVVDGFKTGTSDFGDWVAFTGEFEAETPSGEVYISRKCFIPDPAQGMLETALAEHDTIEIAFDISIKWAKNAYGYEYVCIPVLPVKRSDALLSLKDKIAGTLPAPEKVTPGQGKTDDKKSGK